MDSTIVWRVIDRIVCFLFVCVIVVGAKNKFGKKNQFNDDFTSLEVMKSVRGFAAMGVILHHISQEFAFQESGVLTPFVNAGAYFVAVFFFCSGYGLIKSFDSKKDYLKGFIKKRIIKSIVVPFYVDAILYGLFYFLVKIHFERAQWVTNLLGITMMNVYAWFPIVLSLLYLVFFLSFRFVKNRKACFVIIGVFTVLMGVGACINGHMAWWAGPANWWMDDNFWETSFKWWMDEKIFWFQGEWWVNSAPAFLAGLIFATYENKIVPFFKNKYGSKFFVLILITLAAYGLNAYGQTRFGYWTEFNMRGPEIDKKILTYFCQIPLMFIFPFTVFMFLMKYYVVNPVSRFFGKYSLHTYLMNLMALTLLRFLSYNVEESPFYMGGVYPNLLAFAIGVIILSVLLGVGEQKLTDRVQALLFSKRQKVVYSTAPRFMDDDDLKKIRKEEQLKEKEASEQKSFEQENDEKNVSEKVKKSPSSAKSVKFATSDKSKAKSGEKG